MICGLLPYGVICKINTNENIELKDIFIDGVVGNKGQLGFGVCKYGRIFQEIEDVKPYLRPMESMTEEEKAELKDIILFGYSSNDYDRYEHRGVEIVELEYDNWDKIGFDFADYCKLENWLNKNHLDYRGLIPMGLALEAPEDMYKN